MSLYEEYNFSKRTNWEMAANDLMQSLHELRQDGTLIIDLTESNPTRCQFAYPKDKILSALSDPGNMLYDPSPSGSMDAREAVAQYYGSKGFSVDPRQIFLTASTSEAYTFLFRLLANPSERILFPRPSYPLFEFLVDINDLKMDVYSLEYKKGPNASSSHWGIDFDSLNAEVQSTTRGIVLVNPNNPTGSFVKSDEIKQLNKVCYKNNMALISDEVFLDYQFMEGHVPVSFVDNCEVLTFVMGGLSKTLGLPQMKLSWIVINGPKHLISAASDRLEVILDTYLSVNTPAQHALKTWLAWQPQINKEILSRVKRNYQFMAETLKEAPECEFYSAQGGWYAIVKLPAVQKEEDWVMDFLKLDQVFVHPGYFFDFPQEPCIVISLLPVEAVFQDGFSRIKRRVISQVAQ